MNQATALTYLGYEHEVDFVVRNGLITWLSDKPQPTEEERNSAIFGQRVNTHRRQYNLRQARKILLKPLPASPTGKQIQQRLDAQLLISGGT